MAKTHRQLPGEADFGQADVPARSRLESDDPVTIRTAVRQPPLEAWVASLTLHGMFVMLAVIMASLSKPLPMEETFQWNVSLVEMPREPSVDSTATAVPQPDVRPMQPAKAMAPVVAPDVQSPRRNAVYQKPPSIEAPNVRERPRVQEKERPVSVQEQEEVVAQIFSSNKEVAPAEEPQRFEQVPDPIVQPTPPVEVPSPRAQASTARHAEAPGSLQAKEIPQSVGEGITHPVVTPPPAQPMAPAVEAHLESEPAQTSAVPSEPVVSRAPTEPLQASASSPT